MSQAPTTMQWLRTAVNRIRIGTGVLARSLIQRGHKAGHNRARGLGQVIRGWLGESTGLLDSVVRWGMLAAAVWVASVIGRLTLGMGAHALAGARWLMWPAATVYVVAAYRSGDPEAKLQPEEGSDAAPEGSDEGDTADLPFVPRLVFLAMLYAELGDGRAVHLAHMAKALARHYPEHAWDVPSVAALCASHQITTADKVRAHGKGATRGVRREALPPPSGVFSMAPSVDVDVARQESSTGPSTSTSTDPSTEPRGLRGEGFVTVPDGANPHRTHVRWVDQQSS
jgi:hypothetical protein